MNTITTTVVDPADVALKAKHRAMWASGDYAHLAEELIWSLGPELVRAAGVRRGQRVLDVAAGSGNAAIPAALTGAEVIATDLTPELFEPGRREAAEVGATLRWEQADAEALPYDDASFDVVLSCLGVMFAPHHQRAADELVAGVPAGRHHRPAELDAGGLHRPDVRDHEAVRRAAAARRPAASALGQRAARACAPG